LKEATEAMEDEVRQKVEKRADVLAFTL